MSCPERHHRRIPLFPSQLGRVYLETQAGKQPRPKSSLPISSTLSKHHRPSSLLILRTLPQTTHLCRSLHPPARIRRRLQHAHRQRVPPPRRHKTNGSTHHINSLLETMVTQEQMCELCAQGPSRRGTVSTVQDGVLPAELRMSAADQSFEAFC